MRLDPNYSDLIYQKMIYKGDSVYKDWTLDKAIAEAQKAYEIKAQPIYRHQEAQINFVKGEYQKAYDIFMDLTKTDFSAASSIWRQPSRRRISRLQPRRLRFCSIVR